MTLARTDRRPPPSRFRDPLTHESGRLALFRRLYRLPRPKDEEIARFRDTLYEGDPLADTLVEWMDTLPSGEGRSLIARGLEVGIDQIPNAPPPLDAFFREVEARPAWVDDDKMRLAARTAGRVSLNGSHVLGSVCLMGGYRSSAANKPLVMTGALERMAYRRLAETSKFVSDLYDSETMSWGSEGFRGAVMVRVMHAMVRQKLMRDPRWRPEDWGLPINQADMLATNLLFSSAYVIALRMLGRIISRREADALVHFWRYVGYVMGVRLEQLPEDFGEAALLTYLSNACQPPGDEDSRRLAAALLDVPIAAGSAGGRVGGFLGRLVSDWGAGLSRVVLGPEESEQLGLPATPMQYAVGVTVGTNLCLEALRLVLPFGDELAFAIGHRRIALHLRMLLKGHRPDYQPYPARLAHA